MKALSALSTFCLLVPIVLAPSFCWADGPYSEWLVSSYSDALAAETRDPEWAEPIETEINLLLADAGFANFEVSCGSKICRISVELDSNGPALGVFEGVLLHATPKGESVSIGLGRNGEREQVVFLMREGTALPSLDESTFVGEMPTSVVSDPGPPVPYQREE